jgi:hypothetical protein
VTEYVRPTYEEVRGERIQEGSQCDRGCAADGGTCIGRAESDHSRPIVYYPGAEIRFYDLTVDRITNPPPDCPHGFGNRH